MDESTPSSTPLLSGKLVGAVRYIGRPTILLNIDYGPAGYAVRVRDQIGVNLKLGDPIAIYGDGSVYWKKVKLERLPD